MADIHQLPTLRSVEQEASEWIARLEAEDVTPEDRARFAAWLRANPQNSQAFEDVSATWRRFVVAGPLADMKTGAGVPADSDAGADVNAGASATAGSDGSPEVGVGGGAHTAVVLQHRKRNWGLAIAAATVVAALLTSVYMQKAPHLTAITTAVGEQVTVPLADGSFMELNSNSVARIDYTSRQRTIHLDRGEAFFRVAHDTRRPFWVTAGGGWVRAVGTEFNVYLRPQSLQVTVREGTVRAGESRGSLSAVQPDEQKLAAWVTLSGGQQADLDSTAARKRALSADELADTVAWRSGTVYFENRPLTEVVDELNRYSAAPLILEDPALRALPVGGAFQASPKGAAALVRMLEQNFDVQVRQDGSGVHLHSPPQQPTR
jgi:transmembrane sensor